MRAHRADARDEPERPHRAKDVRDVREVCRLREEPFHVGERLRQKGDLRDFVGVPPQRATGRHDVGDRPREVVARADDPHARRPRQGGQVAVPEVVLEIDVGESWFWGIWGGGEGGAEERDALRLGAVEGAAVHLPAEREDDGDGDEGRERGRVRAFGGIEEIDAQLHEVREIPLRVELRHVLRERPSRQGEADAWMRGLVREEGVRQREGGHRLDDGHGAPDDAGIVASLHRKRCGLHRLQVDGGLFQEDRRRRPQRHAERDRHAACASAEDAALAVRRGAHHAALHGEGVVEHRAREARTGEARAERDALHAGDREERGGQLRFEAVEERAAEARRDARDGADDGAAHGVARVARPRDFVGHLFRIRLAVDRLDARRDGDAARLQELQTDPARRAERRGEAARVLAAARRDAAHLDPLPEVGVAGTRDRPLRAVVARARVNARDLAAERRARRHAVHEARRERHAVGLAARRRKGIAPRRAPFHERRERRLVDAQPGGQVRERKRHPPRMGRPAHGELQAGAEFRREVHGR